MATVLLAVATSMASFAQQRPDPAIGTWRGPIQFSLKGAQGELPDAHSVAVGVIEIAPDGVVRGVVSDAGCTILGLGREFVTPNSASLDLTFKGCTDTRFRRRYSGHLTDGGPGKPKNLILSSPASLPPSTAQLSGVMRR